MRARLLAKRYSVVYNRWIGSGCEEFGLGAAAMLRFLPRLFSTRSRSKHAAARPVQLVRYLSSPPLQGQPIGTEDDLLEHIMARIQISGKLTLRDYMQEVLVNPIAGYYMKQGQFGAKGDFITAPELTSIFGELVGVWALSKFEAAGRPAAVDIVELGPGRGTLMKDALGVFSRSGADVMLHMVEAGLHQSAVQEATLRHMDVGDVSTELKQDPSERGAYREAVTQCGTPAAWYRSLDSVPLREDALTIIWANEYLDALPIHVLKYTEQGWRELLVDVNEDQSSGQLPLRFVLDTEASLASMLLESKGKHLLPHVDASPKQGDTLELCLEAQAETLAICDALSKSSVGGEALLIDYGPLEPGFCDSFRAFRAHKQVHPLSAPGTADLTADVAFWQLMRAIQAQHSQISVGAPMTQGEFLMQLRITTRARNLIQGKSKAEARQIVEAVKMLVEPAQMGSSFKVLTLSNGPRAIEKAAVDQTSQDLLT